MAKFELKKAENGEYFFHLCASLDNKIILKSELYKAKSSCENGISSVKVNSTSDDRYEKLSSTNGKYYFNLKALNGQVVGTSQLYEKETDSNDAIALVKAQAPSATITDLS